MKIDLKDPGTRWRVPGSFEMMTMTESAMKSIHIQMMIGSETVHIPELRPLIGQTVDIVVTPTTGLEAPTDWLPDFWEKIKKGWQGEPLVRPDQGVCEVRDKLR